MTIADVLYKNASWVERIKLRLMQYTCSIDDGILNSLLSDNWNKDANGFQAWIDSLDGYKKLQDIAIEGAIKLIFETIPCFKDFAKFENFIYILILNYSDYMLNVVESDDFSITKEVLDLLIIKRTSLPRYETFYKAVEEKIKNIPLQAQRENLWTYVSISGDIIKTKNIRI